MAKKTPACSYLLDTAHIDVITTARLLVHTVRMHRATVLPRDGGRRRREHLCRRHQPRPAPPRPAQSSSLTDDALDDAQRAISTPPSQNDEMKRASVTLETRRQEHGRDAGR